MHGCRAQQLQLHVLLLVVVLALFGIARCISGTAKRDLTCGKLGSWQTESCTKHAHTTSKAATLLRWCLPCRIGVA
jgi:hypothetical protein